MSLSTTAEDFRGSLKLWMHEFKMIWKHRDGAIKGRKLKTSHSKPSKCYCPPKIDVVASFFARPRTDANFYSEDGRLSSRFKIIIKLDEKLD